MQAALLWGPLAGCDVSNLGVNCAKTFLGNLKITGRDRLCVVTSLSTQSAESLVLLVNGPKLRNLRHVLVSFGMIGTMVTVDGKVRLDQVNG